MKTLSFSLSIFLAASALASPAPKPLRFDRVPLGNVARVLSARFHAPVTIEANATAPITGDFSGLNLRQALAAAAAQSGLEVVSLGKDDRAGYLLKNPPPIQVGPGPEVGGHLIPCDTGATPATAAERRAALLRRRADLLKAAADLPAGGAIAPSPP